MKQQIVVDFAETLVKERPMIEWVLYELRSGGFSPWKRLWFAANSFTRGLVSMVFGRFPSTSEWAAKVAYMNFQGISQESLMRFVGFRKDNANLLNLNPGLLGVLLRIKHRNGTPGSEILDVAIHSQGTCREAIELFIQREDVMESLAKSGIRISSIVANQMEVRNGRFTGHLLGKIITKQNKPRGIPEGSIFIGDKHDEKAVRRLKDAQFEFINWRKPTV